MFDPVDLVNQIIPIIKAAGKTVVVSLMGSRLVEEANQILRANRIPDFEFPEDAVSALGALWRYRLLRQRDQYIESVQLSRTGKDKAEAVLNRLSSADGFADPEVTAALLDAYGLPVLPLVYAATVEQAVAAAAEIGFPVAMKLAVSAVSHKSDVGGVRIGLKDERSIVQAFEDIREKAEAVIGPESAFGVYLQKMAPDGQEVIVGAVRDPVFGPMVMFGAGGTDVEGLGDVAFALAPITRADLDDILNETWAGRKLKGFRQHKPADIPALRTVITRLGQLMSDFPMIAEIDINPLRVLEEGQGCWVVDARMVIESDRH